MRSIILTVSFAFVATVFARPQGSSPDYSQSGPPNGNHGPPDWAMNGHNGTHGPPDWVANGYNGTHGHGNGTHGNCLSDDDVSALIKGYTYLLQKPGGPDFNSTANSILSSKFKVMSDSINTLGNRPLGTPAYPSLQAFLASQAVTPPLPVVSTLTKFHSCNQISWRWNASGIQNPKVPVATLLPVLGMITFDVDMDLKKIDTVYSEFNTAAFQHDLGNPECQQK